MLAGEMRAHGTGAGGGGEELPARDPRRWLGGAILLAVAALLLAACSGGPDERFAAETVSSADVAEQISAPGAVQAAGQAELTAPSSGQVAELGVRDGGQVRRGQLVVRLSSPQVDDSVRQAEAALDAAGALTTSVPAAPTGDALEAFGEVQAQVAASSASVLEALRAALPLVPADRRGQARRRLDRAERRIERAQAASRRAAEGAAATAGATTAALNSALTSATAAQRAQAEAAYQLAKDQQERLSLRAPISGTVQLGRVGEGAAAPSLPPVPGLPEGADQAIQGLAAGSARTAAGPLLRVGSQVSAGQTVATVLDIARFTVAAEVDETDIALVRSGQRGTVELDAFPGARFGARVTRVALTPTGAQPAGGGVSYQVDLDLGRLVDAAGGARPSPRVGMTATAEIEVRSARDALSVASSALVGRGDGQAVYVIEGDRVHLRPIRLTAAGEERVAVAEGLRAGERVVTRGAERLRDGQEYPGT
jgi:HlyD family secretion protein